MPDSLPTTPAPARKPSRILMIIGIVVVSFVLLVILLPDFDGKGAPSYARKWTARLNSVQSAAEADAKFSGFWSGRIYSRKFPNGEWLFGICDDSHSNPWGGTIVVRDSHGQTRSFFGHVCGTSFLRRITENTSEVTTLDQFYAYLVKTCHFTEWSNPQAQA